jgi:hypothetical protein
MLGRRSAAEAGGPPFRRCCRVLGGFSPPVGRVGLARPRTTTQSVRSTSLSSSDNRINEQLPARAQSIPEAITSPRGRRRGRCQRRGKFPENFGSGRRVSVGLGQEAPTRNRLLTGRSRFLPSRGSRRRSFFPLRVCRRFPRAGPLKLQPPLSEKRRLTRL